MSIMRRRMATVIEREASDNRVACVLGAPHGDGYRARSVHNFNCMNCPYEKYGGNLDSAVLLRIFKVGEILNT